MFLQWTQPTATRRSLDQYVNDRVTPAADVLDDGESYQVVLEMPGVTQEGLTIQLEARELVVRGERQAYGKDAKLLYASRSHGSRLEKRFSLGEDVERSAVTANLENGLLTVTLPRKAEVKARKIEVEVK
jgi:HSP20 family molecular chaperone IbpA